jgi:hypothetical protein
MKAEDFVKILRETFYEELSVKTSWGRDEMKLAFERALTAAVCRSLQKEL